MIKNKEFQVHKLNPIGLAQCELVARLFDDFLTELEKILLNPQLLDSNKSVSHLDKRLEAIVRTKLEEACFFAKKSIATQECNQKD